MNTSVLLLFGGESTEHEVSLSSARNVAAALDPQKFDVRFCFIDKTGRWWLTDGIDDELKGDRELRPILGGKSFVAGEETVTPDVILPILHGRNGEDGAVQALADLVHIPIVGCDMTSSAIAMNKYVTKQLVNAQGIQIVPFNIHRSGDAAPDYQTVTEELGKILFVKPANSGSSVGVTKVRTEEEFEAAVNEAHRYADVILIETAIDGRELEVAVLGNYPGIDTSVVGEIKPDGEYYSYEAKYAAASQSEVIVPADIPDELSQQLRDKADAAFQAIGCRGMARVDFFVAHETGEIYLSELNTIPGFTDISMYPKLWEGSGMTYSALLEELIRLALDGTMKEKE